LKADSSFTVPEGFQKIVDKETVDVYKVPEGVLHENHKVVVEVLD